MLNRPVIKSFRESQLTYREWLFDDPAVVRSVDHKAVR